MAGRGPETRGIQNCTGTSRYFNKIKNCAGYQDNIINYIHYKQRFLTV